MSKKQPCYILGLFRFILGFWRSNLVEATLRLTFNHPRDFRKNGKTYPPSFTYVHSKIYFYVFSVCLYIRLSLHFCLLRCFSSRFSVCLFIFPSSLNKLLNIHDTAPLLHFKKLHSLFIFQFVLLIVFVFVFILFRLSFMF